MRIVTILVCLALFSCSSIDYAGLGDPTIGITLSKGDYKFLSNNNNSKEFKNFICKKRVLKERVVAVIPRFPGVPLTEASDNQERCRKNVRAMAHSFWYESEPSVVGTRLPEDIGLTSELLGVSVDEESPPVEYAPIFFPLENKMYLYPMNAIKGGWDNQASAPLQGVKLQHSHTAEIWKIISNFTPLLPDGVLASMPGSNFEKCSTAALMAMGPNLECWAPVFNYATSVKESVQKGNPNVINFDITLDLDLFCKYGRPNSDLVSK